MRLIHPSRCYSCSSISRQRLVGRTPSPSNPTPERPRRPLAGYVLPSRPLPKRDFPWASDSPATFIRIRWGNGEKTVEPSSHQEKNNPHQRTADEQLGNDDSAYEVSHDPPSEGDLLGLLPFRLNERKLDGSQQSSRRQPKKIAARWEDLLSFRREIVQTANSESMSDQNAEEYPVNRTLKGQIDKLMEAVKYTRILRERVHQLYHELPKPRMLHLTHEQIDLLLKRLWWNRRSRDWPDIKYLHLMKDVRDANYSLSRTHWRRAIGLITSSQGAHRNAAMDRVIRLWQDYEQQYGKEADVTTLNLVYHAAIKNGRLDIADRVRREISNRGLKIDRFTRTAEIRLFGLQKDGASIRRAYRDAIQHNEIVDVTILNSVMSALFQAGESQAALGIYYRLKMLHAKLVERKRRQRPRSTAEMHQVARKYRQATSHLQDQRETLAKVQKTANFHPDAQTFRILTRQLGMQPQGYEDMQNLRQDMQTYSIQPDCLIYTNLFRGYANFGRREDKGTPWPAAELDQLWQSYLSAYPPGVDRRFDLGRAGWVIALRAFTRCKGRARAEEMWKLACERWPQSRRTRMDIQKFLATLPHDSQEVELGDDGPRLKYISSL